MSADNGAFGVHVNALVNAKNGQLLPYMQRMTLALENLSEREFGAANVSATASSTTEPEKDDSLEALKARLLKVKIASTGQNIAANGVARANNSGV